MANKAILEGIGGLLCLYSAIVKVRDKSSLSAHQIRVLLAIHYLNQIHLKVTRKAVARHTYLWLSSVKGAVSHFVDAGLIEPVLAPRYYLKLTAKAQILLAEIEADYKRQQRFLVDGKPISNSPARAR